MNRTEIAKRLTNLVNRYRKAFNEANDSGNYNLARAWYRKFLVAQRIIYHCNGRVFDNRGVCLVAFEA